MALPKEVQALADAGYAVVPATAQKRPLVPWRQWTERKQTDAERADLPRGDLYAIVTGELYGLVVLDFDMKIEGRFIAIRPGLVLQPNVLTASGGAHVWVKHPGYPVKTCAGVLPQVDVRGEGGLIYVYGTTSKGQYRIMSTILDDWSDVADLLPERTVAEGSAPHGSYRGDGAGIPSAVRVLQRECDRIRNAEPGTSNSVTTKAAYNIGGLVGAGELDGDSAYEALLSAADARGVGDPERVIGYQMAVGAESPWSTLMERNGKKWTRPGETKAETPKRIEVPTVVPPLTERLPLPLAAFPKEVRALVEEGAPVLSAPPQYLAVASLPSLATALGGTVTLGLRKNWRIPPSLYVALVGPPGASKSPAIKLALQPAFDAHLKIWDTDPDPKGTARLVLEDVTIERLADLLVANRRGLMFYADELKSFFAGMGQYKEGGGADRAFYLKAWNGESISQSRVKRGDIFIPQCNLNVIGGVQPQVFDALTYEEQDGMIERFLLVYSDPIPGDWTDDDVSDATLDGYSTLWNRMRDFGMQDTIIPVTGDAFATWKAWYQEFERNPNLPDHLAYVQPKVRTHIARIALILAAAEGETCDSSHIERAIEITRYLLDQANVVYEAADFMPKDVKQWVKAREALLTFITKYQAEHGENPSRSWCLTRGPGFCRKARTLDEMLAELGIAL